jgi:hypothetical protein
MTINIKGYDVLIDDEDCEKVLAKHWTSSSKGELVYFISGRNGYGDGFLSLHRYILNAPKGSIVDHIDGNTLNNCKLNLRICTQKDNARNRKMCFDNKIGYRGVTETKYHKYRANIFYNHKSINLGIYDTAEEASEIYEYTAKAIYKEYYRSPENKINNELKKWKRKPCFVTVLQNEYAIRIRSGGRNDYIKGFKTKAEAQMEYDRIQNEIENAKKRARRIKIEKKINELLIKEGARS